MTKEELENYEPKGQLEGFPKEIIARMLECQEEQGNKRDVTIFENNKRNSIYDNGFAWEKTKERWWFWDGVINNEDFNLFFEKYPKQDNQEFRVGDKVIDIIRGKIGKVIGIYTLNKDSYPIFVDFDDNQTAAFTLDGMYCSSDKYPRLLHYRDDYDYSIIDFNNLPQRQELKRWRAKVEETYYTLSSNFKIEQHYEKNDSFNDEAYDSGNYFQTKEQAQEVVDKLKEYFNQLINKIKNGI